MTGLSILFRLPFAWFVVSTPGWLFFWDIHFKEKTRKFSNIRDFFDWVSIDNGHRCLPFGQSLEGEQFDKSAVLIRHRYQIASR
jgi:hypothetical protein